MEIEPLSPACYSLAGEARLLRRLIDEAPSPSLKQGLVLALARVLQQDEERAIRSNETLAAGAVFSYVDDCLRIVAEALREEFPEDEAFFRVTDKIAARLALLTPRNTAADLKLLK